MEEKKFSALAKIDDPLGPLIKGGAEATLKCVLGLLPGVREVVDVAYFAPKEELKKKRVEDAVNALHEKVSQLQLNPLEQLIQIKDADIRKYENICAALEQIYDKISEERDLNKRNLLIQHLKTTVIGLNGASVDLIQEYTEILTILNIRDIEVFKWVMSRMGNQDGRNMTVDAASSNIPGISKNQVLISFNRLYSLGLIDFATQGRSMAFGVSGALSEGIARYNGYGAQFFEYLTRQL